MLRHTMAMSQRACCRGVCRVPAAHARTGPATLMKRRMVATGACNRLEQYAISLDEALRGIMSESEYYARAQQTPGYRPPSVSLPRSIADRAGLTLTQTDFERIMGTNDLVGVEYLEQGMRAAAAVARILILDPADGQRGYATGFMVAPRLLLTNRHVLPNIDVARASMAEFGYEYDVSGISKPTQLFRLTPDEVFIVGNAANEDADFALVAVAPFAERSRMPVTTFGYLRLDDQPGKVAENEFITIIQHPGGRHKQIALRENEVLAKGSNDKRPVLLYRSDTAPGSSGSPCFNDQWQVVALHSRGVLKNAGYDPQQVIRRGNATSTTRESMSQGELAVDDLAYEANLGVRISFIVDSIREAHKEAPQRLLTAFLADVQRGGSPVVQLDARPPASLSPFGPQTPAIGTRAAQDTAAVDTEAGIAVEYADGFDPNFLGVPVPLPKITPKAELYGRALMLPTGGYELKYPHFSVIMNEHRRLAFVSACNIDGALKISIRRSNKFFVDKRIDASQQTDDYLYFEDGGPEDEFFDRGHLTRRDDVAWGDTKEEAKAASDASFAFPNISPQHRAFNQSQLNGVWGQLENYVLDQTVDEEIKACIFNGPIFNVTDLWYKGVPIPKEFFKIVVIADPNRRGRVRASAYIASQADLVADDLLKVLAREQGVEEPKAKPEEEFPIRRPFVMKGGRRRYVDVWQVTIAEVERRTGLQFNAAMRNGSVVPGPDDGTEASFVPGPPSPSDGGGDERAEEAVAVVRAFPRKKLRSLQDVVL